jgi:phosphatidylglycerol:prolipoprotein diacylglycerol transferase
VVLTAIVALIYFPLMLRNPKYQIRDDNSIKKPSMLLYLDAIAPAVLIGQVIGRFGNYYNQELYGSVVTDQNTIDFMKNLFPWMNITQDNITA